MASRTGTHTIVESSRTIARMVQRHGAADLDARTTPEFGDCVRALVACFIALLATDENILKIDRHAPFGPEDTPPA